eukprot:1160290-Pelagomonas_calceolata.AAC.3
MPGGKVGAAGLRHKVGRGNLARRAGAVGWGTWSGRRAKHSLLGPTLAVAAGDIAGTAAGAAAPEAGTGVPVGPAVPLLDPPSPAAPFIGSRKPNMRATTVEGFTPCPAAGVAGGGGAPAVVATLPAGAGVGPTSFPFDSLLSMRAFFRECVALGLLPSDPQLSSSSSGCVGGGCACPLVAAVCTADGAGPAEAAAPSGAGAGAGAVCLDFRVAVAGGSSSEEEERVSVSVSAESDSSSSESSVRNKLSSKFYAALMETPLKRLHKLAGHRMCQFGLQQVNELDKMLKRSSTSKDHTYQSATEGKAA